MRYDVKTIRKALNDLPFPFWVRKWRDGEIWVGAEHGSESKCTAIVTALEGAGYFCVTYGKPGTEGQWVVEIITPVQPVTTPDAG